MVFTVNYLKSLLGSSLWLGVAASWRAGDGFVGKPASPCTKMCCCCFSARPIARALRKLKIPQFRASLTRVQFAKREYPAPQSLFSTFAVFHYLSDALSVVESLKFVVSAQTSMFTCTSRHFRIFDGTTEQPRQTTKFQL